VHTLLAHLIKMEQCRAQMGLKLHLGATGAQQLGMPAPPVQLQLGMPAPPALLQLGMHAPAAQLQLGMHAPAAQLQLGMHAPPALLQPGMHAPPALQLDTQAPIVVGGLVSSMMDAMLQQPAAPADVQHLVWQQVAVGEQYPFTEMTWEAGCH
jgi:hypothetical protein